ncbi:MAG: hypothetical protein NW215_14785 [Hyphomicrobiales bacterium]|nr:hypothetical protein [Hyphomicrobiales bacterium]
MTSHDPLQAEWNALSLSAKRHEWRRYTLAIDDGRHGWHKFHLILWTLWQCGEPPG